MSDMQNPAPQVAYEEVYVEVPQWPKIVGILSIIWGSLGTCCGGMGTVYFMFMPQILKAAEQQMGPAPKELVPSPPMIGMLAFGVVVTIILIIAGALTIKRSSAGRLAHLVYAVLSIAGTAAYTYFAIQYQNNLQAWVQANGDSQWASQGGAQMGAGAQNVMTALTVALSVAWPVFCLIWFGLVKRTRESMTGVPEADPLAPVR
ncbi:MAG: hypothetical protein HEQ23_12935 [Tepidisphaera sp.]